jgi:hypothetical protein
MKRCKHCGEVKSLEDFYTDRKARDGRRPECKKCNLATRAAKYRENPRPAIERVMRWQRDNREKYQAKQREYAESGKKKISDRKSHLKRNYGMTSTNSTHSSLHKAEAVRSAASLMSITSTTTTAPGAFEGFCAFDAMWLSAKWTTTARGWPRRWHISIATTSSMPLCGIGRAR